MYTPIIALNNLNKVFYNNNRMQSATSSGSIITSTKPTNSIFAIYVAKLLNSHKRLEHGSTKSGEHKPQPPSGVG
jgi:hypothetical protein